jgi:hypothetical protein
VKSAKGGKGQKAGGYPKKRKAVILGPLIRRPRVTVRLVLVLLVLGFIGLLLVMGAIAFVRWLKVAHPGHYRSILGGLAVAFVAVSIWGFLETTDRPTFHAGDLLTLQEPLVARIVPTDRDSSTTSCMVDIYEHLAVVSVGSGTMKARVDRNKSSGPGFCPVGAEVQFELGWLHRYTLTHRHS